MPEEGGEFIYGARNANAEGIKFNIRGGEEDGGKQEIGPLPPGRPEGKIRESRGPIDAVQGHQ